MPTNCYLIDKLKDYQNVSKDFSKYLLQGVPYHWAHFVFVIFSGSRAHTEELFKATG